MRVRTDFEPVFFAPFVSSPMRIERGGVGPGGHLEMAHAFHLFDRARAEALTLLGLGLQYARSRRSAFATTDMQVRHVRGVGAGAPVRATVRLVDYDERRLHLFLQLHQVDEGWVFAVSEQRVEHVSTATGCAVPLPDDVLERVAGMKAVHATLPRLETGGRWAPIAVRS